MKMDSSSHLPHTGPFKRSSLSSLSTDAELRVGRGSGRHQENPERHAACWERQGRKRQVQNPAPDPPRQHQAAYWRVWIHVSRSTHDAQERPVVLLPSHRLTCESLKPASAPGSCAFLLFVSAQDKDQLRGFRPLKAWPGSSWPVFCFLDLNPEPNKSTLFYFIFNNGKQHTPLPCTFLVKSMLACIFKTITRPFKKTGRDRDGYAFYSKLNGHL